MAQNDSPVFGTFQAELYSKQLSIVLEPEACSVVCHHEAGKQIGIDLVKAGSQYLIVDAAGIIALFDFQRMNGWLIWSFSILLFVFQDIILDHHLPKAVILSQLF